MFPVFQAAPNPAENWKMFAIPPQKFENVFKIYCLI